MTTEQRFLPISKQEMEERGWGDYDVLLVTADAYVDHPSFGAAIIGRVLEAEGYRVAVLAQPDWHSVKAFQAMGRPRLAALVSGGNIDSMVAHYTAAKKRRGEDLYSPGGHMGLRPDRPCIVYSGRLREAFPGLPIVVGGLEASLRRFAHYDYWDDKVRRSLLADSGADLLTFGMGERAGREILALLDKGVPVGRITGVRGTAYLTGDKSNCPFPSVECPSFEAVCADRKDYARATMLQYDEHDPIRGRAVIQAHGQRYLVVNPPAMPLTTAEFDQVAELPYAREVHPVYDKQGGVPAIEEVRFSVTHNRGCFGACHFCSLAFHQGRMISARSHDSVLREVEAMTKDPLFKGYVHDVGGPTANFRRPSCKKQLEKGLCKKRSCLTPKPCPQLDADHGDYLALLRKLRKLPGVKKVFIRSGIRFDYLLCDSKSAFFSELVQHHVSGQLKVAPEHCVPTVLDYMGKPPVEVYERFQQKYRQLNQRHDKEQYLVPYLMSSHPGCTLQDAVALAEYLNRTGRQPEQVQDFYPTPGTLSTCMYYTGLDPRTMRSVFVARTQEEKALQRALLQWKRPEKRRLVKEALQKADREDLIGYGKRCLIRPDQPPRREAEGKARDRGRPAVKGKPTGCKTGAPKPGKAAAARPRKGRKAAAGSGKPKKKR